MSGVRPRGVRPRVGRPRGRQSADDPAPRAGIALVTGSSQGIGRAVAAELAARGYDLVLAALPESGLPETARALASQFAVSVDFIEADLTRRDDVARVVEQVHESIRLRGEPLQVLVNNAGVDIAGCFDDVELELLEMMVELNALAVVRLTRMLIDDLKNGAPAWILNVASAAAFFPMPYKPVYSSTKAFVLYLSRALGQELKPDGIHVAALCPGGVLTNADVCERIAIQGFFGRVSSMKPEELAPIVVRRLFKRKKLIVPGWANRLFQVMGKIMPLSVIVPFVYRRFGRDEVVIARRRAQAE